MMSLRRIVLVATCLVLILIGIVLADQAREYSACYIRGYNDRWVVFIPHWEYGNVVYVIFRDDPQVQPIRVVDREVQNGQWVKLSEASDHLAVSQILENGRGRLKILSLPTGSVMWEDTFPSSILVETFDPQGVFFSTIDDNGGNLYLLDTRLWNLEETHVMPQRSSAILETPTSIMEQIKARAPWCASWPGIVYSD